MSMKTPLDTAPDHAAALGRLVGHWGAVESVLIDVLGRLLGTEQSRTRIVFATILSLRTKVEMTIRLANVYIIECPEKIRLLGLLNEVLTLNGERNAMIHALWGSDDAGQLHRLRLGVPSNTKKWIHDSTPFNAAQIQDEADKIGKVHLELLRFVIDDLSKLQMLQRPD